MTTSFEDIVLVPLPCWGFLLAVLVFFGIKHSKRSKTAGGEKQAEEGGGGGGEHPPARQHLRLRWTTYLFFLFTFGVLLLSIDEIVRLAILKWGVGLLPLVPVTTLIATALYLMRYRIGARYPGAGVEIGLTTLLLAFWLAMIIVEIVKIHTLAKLQPQFPRDDTTYRMSMQVMDVAINTACMALVYILILVERLIPNWAVQ